ncbi:uncharacterized protein LOC129581755 [Paramacrobiotus metropolitanus]|uniref:uncharacterized protein LOC129581755 n=1 Tax=Paramacrobiotus metropolitanus TaxID=2943436 RepID=UPI0024465CDD|nr:uncharacterized protein LOC129581755 [Paramacrobiotus metropolitanus]
MKPKSVQQPTECLEPLASCDMGTVAQPDASEGVIAACSQPDATWYRSNYNGSGMYGRDGYQFDLIEDEESGTNEVGVVIAVSRCTLKPGLDNTAVPRYEARARLRTPRVNRESGSPVILSFWYQLRRPTPIDQPIEPIDLEVDIEIYYKDDLKKGGNRNDFWIPSIDDGYPDPGGYISGGDLMRLRPLWKLSEQDPVAFSPDVWHYVDVPVLQADIDSIFSSESGDLEDFHVMSPRVSFSFLADHNNCDFSVSPIMLDAISVKAVRNCSESTTMITTVSTTTTASTVSTVETSSPVTSSTTSSSSTTVSEPTTTLRSTTIPTETTTDSKTSTMASPSPLSATDVTVSSSSRVFPNATSEVTTETLHYTTSSESLATTLTDPLTAATVLSQQLRLRSLQQ